VTYIETASASQRTALALLKQYRDDSRTDEGSLRVDLLEQGGKPGRFVIIEAWQDQRTSDRHDASARTKTFLERLQPMLLSPVDARPYKNLSIGAAARVPPATAVYVVTHVDTVPEAASKSPLVLTQLAEASRKEKDNLRFDVLQHSMRGNHFTVIEVWTNGKSADAHAGAAHTLKYRADVQPLLGSPFDERSFRAVY
jgi:quinol monooxygenase YgiN